MSPMPPLPVRKILVRVNNWIGDVVMISPAMRAIRTAFPKAEITLLAKTWVLEALRDSPFCDRLIEYDREGRHAGWGGRYRLLLRLRRERFDLALLFQKAFEAALFARISGIPWRVGFRSDCRSWLLSAPLALPDRGHHVEQFLQIAEAAGASVEDRRLSFHLTSSARDAALRFLRESGLHSDSLRIAIHPGASKAPRSWHPARFGAVGRMLVNEYGVRPLLLGAKQDTPALDVIRSLAGSTCITSSAQNLQEMAALLERCHLLLCNDSGPMHVAAALGVPVVAVFGPGSPDRTGPWTKPSLCRVLTHQYPCSPCRQRFFEECRPAPSGKPLCLDDISPEEALQACRELLGPSPFRPGIA
jgi:lipopolysaccharide heptosyltransferase II